MPSLFMVGVTRFELAASWSRTKRSTNLSHTPVLFRAIALQARVIISHRISFVKDFLCRFLLFCGLAGAFL